MRDLGWLLVGTGAVPSLLGPLVCQRDSWVQAVSKRDVRSWRITLVVQCPLLSFLTPLSKRENSGFSWMFYVATTQTARPHLCKLILFELVQSLAQKLSETRFIHWMVMELAPTESILRESSKLLTQC